MTTNTTQPIEDTDAAAVAEGSSPWEGTDPRVRHADRPARDVRSILRATHWLAHWQNGDRPDRTAGCEQAPADPARSKTHRRQNHTLKSRDPGGCPPGH